MRTQFHYPSLVTKHGRFRPVPPRRRFGFAELLAGMVLETIIATAVFVRVMTQGQAAPSSAPVQTTPAVEFHDSDLPLPGMDPADGILI